MTKQDPNESYYKFINNDKYPIKPGVLPRDVRRIRSFGEHKFDILDYFVSASEKRIYSDYRLPQQLSIKKKPTNQLVSNYPITTREDVL